MVDKRPMLDTGCWILDKRPILDTGYWILDKRLILDAGCSVVSVPAFPGISASFPRSSVGTRKRFIRTPRAGASVAETRSHPHPASPIKGEESPLVLMGRFDLFFHDEFNQDAEMSRISGF